MSLVRCYDDEGQTHFMAAETLKFCPAVYGIFVENDRILLLSRTSVNLYTPPGVVLGDNDIPTQAIRHYFRRLAGITPELGPLLFIEDQFRLVGGQGMHVAAMYYVVKRPFSASLHIKDQPENGAAPEWVDLVTLQRNQFLFGFKAVMAGLARLKANPS